MHATTESNVEFQDLLAEQLRKAPWLVISLAAHVLVGAFILLVMRLDPEPLPPPPPQSMHVDARTEDRVEQALPEEVPPPQEVQEPTESVKEVVAVASEDSEFELEAEQGTLGDSQSYEDRHFNFEGVGLAGGGGGRRGDRFGGRKKLEAGAGRTTQSGVGEGLQWLARHQSADGRWDADEFDAHCEGAPCTGPGSSAHDIGVTGLALLAFLGDGHHPNRETPYQRVVRRGLAFLVEETRESGDDDGLIGGRKGNAFLYDHALAALALCDALVLSGQENLRDPAQRAVSFVLRARNPYKAWRYEAPGNGENDASVTGWMVFVLKTAQDAGLDIDRDALDGAIALFDELTDSSTGRCGYVTRGEPPARPEGRGERFPAQHSESLTAVALLCRIFLGQTPEEHPILDAHADLLLAKPPQWDETGARNDFYYWYYATFAMFQLGGERWARWNEKLKPALLKSQRRDGHAAGSWDPLDPWGQDGGRVYSTAMGVLCLEVYYRYSQILSATSRKPR